MVTKNSKLDSGLSLHTLKHTSVEVNKVPPPALVYSVYSIKQAVTLTKTVRNIQQHFLPFFWLSEEEINAAQNRDMLEANNASDGQLSAQPKRQAPPHQSPGIDFASTML